MTKKLFLIVSLFLSSMLFAEEVKFEEGVHFSRIATDKSQSPQVAEYFSYYCPHCMNFEPIAQRLEQELAKDVFVKSHVNFLRGVSPQIQSLLSRAYIIAKEAGKGNEASEAIFAYIHRHKGSFATIDDVRRLFTMKELMTAEAFNSAAESMPVLAQEQYMLDQQNRFSNLGALTSVPTFIVNDIYRIELRSIKSYDQLKSLVDYLLKK